ncbi:MAG: class I SAM-dependent methyltransferase [Eubacteriaceae bacterium]|nr:class I SAM-dependent methyltransferase [Eubacteriaceae bacterium]
MGFYEEIAKYYDEIFPVGNDQIDFIVNTAGESPKELLDIACGTGGYSVSLAKKGYIMTAVDLDSSMVEALKKKSRENSLPIKVATANMLNLESSIGGNYDTAFCIGNSIVHLNSNDAILEFLTGVKKLLKPQGKLILQVINYDRILKYDVKSLPTIENKSAGLTFQRLYRYDQKENRIYFRTILNVEEVQIENEIPLFPLRSDDLRRLLTDAGFSRIDFMGDFTGKNFDKDNSFLLVAVAS